MGKTETFEKINKMLTDTDEWKKIDLIYFDNILNSAIARTNFVMGVKAVERLIEELDEPQITDEQAWNKIAEAYPESPQSLRNTLDNAVFGKAGEPQKLVVSKFVADWFEKNEFDLELQIFNVTEKVIRKGATTAFEQWFISPCTKPYETLIRMKDGYEVEKEPLYCVKVGKGYFSGFDETKVTYVLDDAPGSLARRVTYKDKYEAEMDAAQIGGTVEEVAEG